MANRSRNRRQRVMKTILLLADSFFALFHSFFTFQDCSFTFFQLLLQFCRAHILMTPRRAEEKSRKKSWIVFYSARTWNLLFFLDFSSSGCRFCSSPFFHPKALVRIFCSLPLSFFSMCTELSFSWLDVGFYLPTGTKRKSQFPLFLHFVCFSRTMRLHFALLLLAFSFCLIVILLPILQRLSQ